MGSKNMQNPPGDGGTDPLIPTLGRQRQMNLSEFEAILICKENFRIARTITQKNLFSENKKKKRKIKKVKIPVKQKVKFLVYDQHDGGY